MFDSGKSNGFKALCYIHRYKPDLIGKMRTDYVLNKQRNYQERADFNKKIAEITRYDLALEVFTDKRIELDLDDGVKKNYQLFQGTKNANTGKDTIDLLAKI